jgi:segregation and condensation protein B
MEKNQLKRSIESLLLVIDKPLTCEQVKQATDADAKDIREAFTDIASELDSRQCGFRLKRLAGGYQLATDASTNEIVKKFVQIKEKRRLSQASLETLSIIAYKQPITRAEIEHIRGVNVDGAMRTLIEKGVIRHAGRKDVLGRPMLYATTKEFLDRFGLGSIQELPMLTEFKHEDIELPDQLKPEQREMVSQVEDDPSDGKNEEA